MGMGAAREAGVRVRITPLDGELPNLALMTVADFHLARGDEVVVTRDIEADLFEDVRYDRVYGSSIFDFSRGRLDRFVRAWPGAIIGGTGSGTWITVKDAIGEDWRGVSYQGYEKFAESIGFTQRGCRLKCKFCVVPRKEGKPESVRTIHEIWRGDPWPRKLHILDNDFFGQPVNEWLARIEELREGRFRVCLSQGINIRLINQPAAEALASIQYRDTRFSERKLYTAWDNFGDEKIFFRGVDTLERAGVPAKHLRAYMLIGFDPLETWERIWRRFKKMVDRGIEPYPMVYNRQRRDLICFQRWVITGLYRIIPWDQYQRETKSAESVEAFMSSGAHSGVRTISDADFG